MTWPWELPRYQALLDGAALIAIAGEPEPDLLAHVDPARLGRARPLEGTKLYIQAVNERLLNWTIAAYPTEGQARQVFGEPDVDRLWDAVASAVRLDAADPVEAWNEHLAELGCRSESLNELSLDAVAPAVPEPTSPSGSCPERDGCVAWARRATEFGTSGTCPRRRSSPVPIGGGRKAPSARRVR